MSPYKLQSGSPCIDSGTNITTALTGNPNAASVDFFGVAVPTGFKPDRGASEWVNPATPPVLTLLSPAILPNSATLGVQVNPGGATTTSYFAFGTTTNYGSFTATNSSAGTNSLSVSNAVSGLLPGTLYHYRAVATSSVGSINTTDSTFTTLSISQPHLSALLVAGGGNLQINFTNTTGASFTVLSTTNLLAPAVTWPVIGLAMEGPAGQYQFTNPPAGNGQQRFYRVRSP